jgi:hypothetical protein
VHPAVDGWLRSIQWASFVTASGPADSVEGALRDLFAAESEEALAAYWRLDNEVVVQGRMYPLVVCLVPIRGLVLALRQGSAVARRHVVELLAEFALGSGHEDLDEPDLVVTGVEAEMRRLGAILSSLLWDADVRVRRAAFEILRVTPGEDDKLVFVAQVLCSDEDQRIRDLAEKWS